MSGMTLADLINHLMAGDSPRVRSLGMDDILRQHRTDPEEAKKNKDTMAKLNQASIDIKKVLEKHFPFDDSPLGDQGYSEIVAKSGDVFNSHVSALLNTMATVYGREAALTTENILEAAKPLSDILYEQSIHNYRVDVRNLITLTASGELKKEQSMAELRHAVDKLAEKKWRESFAGLDSSEEARQRSGCAGEAVEGAATGPGEDTISMN